MNEGLYRSFKIKRASFLKEFYFKRLAESAKAAKIEKVMLYKAV
jgi:hypothetical protein